MNRLNKAILGQNVKALREAIGMSQHDFSTLINISKRTLASIELSSTNISADLLSVISSFYNLKTDDLTGSILEIDYDLRDKIVERHSENVVYRTVLSKKPNLTYAINHKLLQSDFLDVKREVNDIKLFFAQFGWKYIGTSISNALKRENEKINIESHPSKKGTFVYSKR